MKYYSTQRPIVPGSFPKPQGNRVIAITDFDFKRLCPEIEREAWGYLEYEKPLTPGEVNDYELLPVPADE